MQLAKPLLLMTKRCSVGQGTNCSHAKYYFAILDFRGIAISKTIVLTLLIILIRNSPHGFHLYQCLFILNVIEIEQLKIKK